MADLDSRDKRASAVNFGMPWENEYPTPDGGLNQGDRQHIVHMYRAILAGAAVVADYLFMRDVNHTVTRPVNKDAVRNDDDNWGF